jgi:hypothetical protein
MQQVTDHQPGTGSLNDRITVLNDGAVYRVRAEVDAGLQSHLATIQFYRGGVGDGAADVLGVTNEVLIAILLHRLRGFQAGPHRCEENATALGHLGIVLKMLRMREDRVRVEQEANREDGPVDETKKEVVARVRVIGSSLFVGAKQLDLEAVRKTWRIWNEVEAAVLRLDPPVTADELRVLADLPAAASGAANGYAEFLQAIQRQRKV